MPSPKKLGIVWFDGSKRDSFTTNESCARHDKLRSALFQRYIVIDTDYQNGFRGNARVTLMDQRDRATVREDVLRHAEDVLADVESRWGDITRLDPLFVEPFPDDDHSFPESAGAFVERFYPYAAGAVVTDEEDRLLLVYSPARDEWETPGGAGESNETPAETARRETMEESGIECDLTGVLFVQLMEINLDTPETLPIPIISFTGVRIGGDELSGGDIEDHEEITDLAWFGPDELPTEVRNYEQKHSHLLSLTNTTDGV